MADVLEKTVALGLGTILMTRDKAQEMIDDLVKRGQMSQDDAGKMVDEIMERGREGRQEIMAMVKDQVKNVLDQMNVATKDDIAHLEREIRKLDREMPHRRSTSKKTSHKTS